MKYSLFLIVFFFNSCGESSQTNHVVSDTASPTRYQYDSSHGKKIEKKLVTSAFVISQLEITSDENFTDYISFFIKNTGDEEITNILFEKSVFKINGNKSEHFNKKISIPKNDSANFKLIFNYDQLSIKRIRYKSGKTKNYYSDNVFDDNVIHYKLK